MLRRRLAVCGPRALPLVRDSERERMRAWAIHLEPQTECTGTSTGTNQQTKHKGQPSLIGRKPPHARLPVSEGSCQSPDTRDDDSLAQLHSQSYSTSPRACVAAAGAAAPAAPLQSNRVECSSACKLQRCRPKTKRLIYGFALMQTASRAWNIPPSPSQPAAQHNQS